MFMYIFHGQGLPWLASSWRAPQDLGHVYVSSIRDT